jgi:hypothetical protein
MTIPITEKRFKEASGVQFLDNGKVRCQGLAKSRIKKWREEFDDDTTPTEDLWPECQCHLAACPGYHVCKFHGGKTPRTKAAPRTVLDVLPLDLADKYRALMANPEYISRKEDILLIKTRQYELLEGLGEEIGSEEAWGNVAEALVTLRHGDSLNAVKYLEKALQATENKKETWKEFYQTEKLLSDLTTTQVRTAKELQSMATMEQVQSLVHTLLRVMVSRIDAYIVDPALRSEYKLMVVSEIEKLTNTTPSEIMLIDNVISDHNPTA